MEWQDHHCQAWPLTCCCGGSSGCCPPPAGLDGKASPCSSSCLLKDLSLLRTGGSLRWHLPFASPLSWPGASREQRGCRMAGSKGWGPQGACHGCPQGAESQTKTCVGLKPDLGGLWAERSQEKSRLESAHLFPKKRLKKHAKGPR